MLAERAPGFGMIVIMIISGTVAMLFCRYFPRLVSWIPRIPVTCSPGCFGDGGGGGGGGGCDGGL